MDNLGECTIWRSQSFLMDSCLRTWLLGSFASGALMSMLLHKAPFGTAASFMLQRRSRSWQQHCLLRVWQLREGCGHMVCINLLLQKYAMRHHHSLAASKLSGIQSWCWWLRRGAYNLLRGGYNHAITDDTHKMHHLIDCPWPRQSHGRTGQKWPPPFASVFLSAISPLTCSSYVQLDILHATQQSRNQKKEHKEAPLCTIAALGMNFFYKVALHNHFLTEREINSRNVN